MAAKTLFVICAQVLLIQCAFTQYIGRGPTGLGYDGLAFGGGIGSPYGAGIASPYGAGLASPYGLAYEGAGCGCGGVASTGGGFPVTSVSPIAPTGLTIISENAYEGSLAAGGALPFLSAVAIEGVLPTAGVGVISYGCGNGAVGITSESPIATGIVGPQTYAPGAPAYGPGLPYGPGFAGPYGSGLAPGYNGLGGIGCGL